MSLELVELKDAKAGSSAKVLAGFGFNCYSFRARPAGEEIEVLWSAPDFESGTQKASHSGIPLLFPFPGRLRGGEMHFGGKTFPLAAADGRGNAIHGFVLNRPWRVVEKTGTRVVGEFQASRDDRTILDHWPADFRITVSYELVGNELRSEITIHNPDSKPLPFGLGTHPYFRVPLGSKGQADDCRVSVPVGEYWELTDMLPSGELLPTEGRYDLAHGLRFGDTKFDDVFGKLSADGNQLRATVDDPASGRKLTVMFDKAFRECVVYNPPHREAICIEPYTCVPDAYTLAAAGKDTGLRVLEPGKSFQIAWAIRLD